MTGRWARQSRLVAALAVGVVGTLTVTSCTGSSGHHPSHSPTTSANSRPAVGSRSTPSPSARRTLPVDPVPLSQATLLRGGADATVPHGFAPVDYSFVSAGEGWVVGNVDCYDYQGCSGAVLHTVDGTHWSLVSSTPFTTTCGEAYAQGCGSEQSLPTVRFADSRHGYLYSTKQLLSTSDGGHTWQKVADTQVLAMTVDRESALAFTRTCPPTRYTNCALAVLRAPIGGAFVAASDRKIYDATGTTGWLSRQGHTAWLLTAAPPYDAKGRRNATNDLILRSEDDGRTWTNFRVPCEWGYGDGARNLASAPGPVLWTTCGEPSGRGETLLASTDSGATWTNWFVPPRGYTFSDVAPTGPVTGYLLAGASVLMTSDRGQHWSTGFIGHEENTPRELRVGDASHAHFITANAIFSTSDGGRHWTGVVLV